MDNWRPQKQEQQNIIKTSTEARFKKDASLSKLVKDKKKALKINFNSKKKKKIFNKKLKILVMIQKLPGV